MSKSHGSSETKTQSRSTEKANKPADDKAALSPSARSARTDAKNTTDNKNKPVGKKSPDVIAIKSPDRAATNDVTSSQSATAKNSKSSGDVKSQASHKNMFIEEGTAATPSGKTRSSPQHQANKTTSRFDGLYVSDDGFLRAAVDPLGHVIESCPRLTLRINELMDQAVDIDSDLGFSKKRLLPDYYYTSTVPTGATGTAEGDSDEEEGGDESGGGKSPRKGKGKKKKKKGGANAVKADINPGCFAKAPSVFQVIYVPPTLPLSELKMVDFMPADGVVHAA